MTAYQRTKRSHRGPCPHHINPARVSVSNDRYMVTGLDRDPIEPGPDGDEDTRLRRYGACRPDDYPPYPPMAHPSPRTHAHIADPDKYRALRARIQTMSAEA